jgi:cysteinyl-tRNA synthetase
MQIYDTLAGKKETLKKPLFRSLKMFVCGPTVYDHPHIGNARTFTAFDIIARYIRARGFKLFYLQNITDIDDKIIRKAQDENVSWEVIKQRYEDIYKQNLKDLNITSITEFAKATDYIPQIIKQVQTLIKKGCAYKIEGEGWYFDLSKFADYGKLAKRTASQATDGTTRIDNIDKKRNAGDFCLWKFSKENEPSWQSDLGTGRPGWHIEDTAITESFFGPQYDLHGGAIDLKFPHHEAEIAQQESASGKKPFVNIWMHAGFLNLVGEKMSKSLGNFITITELLKKHSGDVFRMMVLSHHYRAPMDYGDELVIAAQKNLNDIKAFLLKLTKVQNGKETLTFDVSTYEKEFITAMDDDFNSPKAIAAIFNVMNAVNKQIWQLSTAQAKHIHTFIAGWLTKLGISSLDIEIPQEIEKLANERELYRSSKQFTQSDALRKQIDALGYLVEDTPVGPIVLPKN